MSFSRPTVSKDFSVLNHLLNISLFNNFNNTSLSQNKSSISRKQNHYLVHSNGISWYVNYKGPIIKDLFIFQSQIYEVLIEIIRIVCFISLTDEPFNDFTFVKNRRTWVEKKNFEIVVRNKLKQTLHQSFSKIEYFGCKYPKLFMWMKNTLSTKNCNRKISYSWRFCYCVKCNFCDNNKNVNCSEQFLPTSHNRIWNWTDFCSILSINSNLISALLAVSNSWVRN